MAIKTRLLPRQLGILRIAAMPPCWSTGRTEENLITPEEFESRLQTVGDVLTKYGQAGGDPERLKVAIFGLVPVVVTLPPPPRELKGSLGRCIKALDEVLALPGPVMGNEHCKNAKHSLEFFLHSQIDQDAYYRYWGPHDEPHEQSERILGIGRPPAIRTGRSGRQRGSSVGMVLAALAHEFTVKFGAPRWADLLRIALAVSHPDLIPPTTTPQHLMVRARPYKKRCVRLHRTLFE